MGWQMRHFEDQRGEQRLIGGRKPTPLQASQASCLLFSDDHRAGSRRRVDSQRVRHRHRAVQGRIIMNVVPNLAALEGNGDTRNV